MMSRDQVTHSNHARCYLFMHGKRSHTCLEIESKYDLFQMKKKKERDNMEGLISFTRNGESRIKREKTCLRALWPPNIN